MSENTNISSENISPESQSPEIKLPPQPEQTAPMPPENPNSEKRICLRCGAKVDNRFCSTCGFDMDEHEKQNAANNPENPPSNEYAQQFTQQAPSNEYVPLYAPQTPKEEYVPQFTQQAPKQDNIANQYANQNIQNDFANQQYPPQYQQQYQPQFQQPNQYNCNYQYPQNKKKHGMTAWIIIDVIMVSVLATAIVLLALALTNRQNAAKFSDDIAIAPPSSEEYYVPNGVSKTEMKKIEIGMSYAQVSKIIGGDGFLSNNGETVQGKEYFIYSWQAENTPNAFLHITFMDDAVSDIVDDGIFS